MNQPYYQTDHTHCKDQGEHPACGILHWRHTRCDVCAILQEIIK